MKLETHAVSDPSQDTTIVTRRQSYKKDREIGVYDHKHYYSTLYDRIDGHRY